MSERFEKLSNEPAPKVSVLELSCKSTRELRRERADFTRDRIGHNGHGRPAHITYLAHARGWVMARHPGCVPFVITEQSWTEFPYYWKEPLAPPAPVDGVK